MTEAEIRDYYDRKVKKKLAQMNLSEQQAMFKRYSDRKEEKRQK